MLDGNIGYSDALHMDIDEVEEANAALDILIEQMKKKPKKGGAG